MRSNRTFLLLSLTLSLFVGIAYCDGAPTQQSTYSALVGRLKSGDMTVDFKALRTAYLSTPEYQSFYDGDLVPKMNKALNGSDFKQALEIANSILDKKYISLDAHYASFIADSKLGNDKDAQLHRSIFLGLVKAITSTGDGKSPETAWQIFEVHEEYVVLSVMGYPRFPMEQSYLKKNGHTFDEMKMTNPQTGKQDVFYFNTDIPDKAMGFGK